MLSKCISRSTCRLKLCQQLLLHLTKSTMNSMLIESSQERKRSSKPSTRATSPWQQSMNRTLTSMTLWVQWTSWIRTTTRKLSRELLSWLRLRKETIKWSQWRARCASKSRRAQMSKQQLQAKVSLTPSAAMFQRKKMSPKSQQQPHPTPRKTNNLLKENELLQKKIWSLANTEKVKSNA